MENDKEYIQIIDADKFSFWYDEKMRELETILREANISYDTGRKITELFDKFNLYGDDEICIITTQIGDFSGNRMVKIKYRPTGHLFMLPEKDAEALLEKFGEQYERIGE